VDFFIDEFKVYSLLEILEALAGGKDMDTAFMEITGYSLKEFEAFWQNSVTK
jgi:hypothetical protein